MSGRFMRRGALVRLTALLATGGLAASLVAAASSASATTSRAPAKIKVAIVPKLLGLPVFEANVKDDMWEPPRFSRNTAAVITVTELKEVPVEHRRSV